VPGVIKIMTIDTKNQFADFLTKALPIALFAPFQEKFTGMATHLRGTEKPHRKHESIPMMT
jgi:hypothetical protein